MTVLEVLARKQNSSELAETVRHIERVAKQRLDCEKIAYIYAKALVLLIFDDSGVEKQCADELVILHDRWTNNESIDEFYGIGLIILINEEQEKKKEKARRRMEDLVKQWPNNIKIWEEYSITIRNQSTYATIDKLLEYHKKIQKITKKFPDNTCVAEVYSIILDKLIEQQFFYPEHIFQTVKELKKLSINWSNNIEIAHRYAKSLINLYLHQEKVEERVLTTKWLESLYNKWPSDAYIAEAYCQGMVKLTDKQDMIEAIKTKNKIQKLADKWYENETIATILADELHELIIFCFAGEEEIREMIQSLESLSRIWPQSKRIIVLYAHSLKHCIVNKKCGERKKMTQRLRELSKVWSRSKEIRDICTD